LKNIIVNGNLNEENLEKLNELKKNNQIMLIGDEEIKIKVFLPENCHKKSFRSKEKVEFINSCQGTLKDDTNSNSTDKK